MMTTKIHNWTVKPSVWYNMHHCYNHSFGIMKKYGKNKNKLHDITVMPMYKWNQMSWEYTSPIFMHTGLTRNVHLSTIIIMASNASNKIVHILFYEKYSPEFVSILGNDSVS